jgi:hypothetical protein
MKPGVQNSIPPKPKLNKQKSLEARQSGVFL